MAFTTFSTTDLLNTTLSGSNLIATATAVGGVRGAHPKRTGKYYIEFTSTTAQNINSNVGFATARAPFASNAPGSAVLISSTAIRVWAYDGSQAAIGSGPSIANGTIVGCAVDLDNRLVWFRASPAGNWNSSASANPATGALGIDTTGAGVGAPMDTYPFVGFGNTANSFTANFGATAFSGTVPSGFTSGWDDSVSPITYDVVSHAGWEAFLVGASDLRVTQAGFEAWISTSTVNPAAVSGMFFS